jgi:AcrR family transcriptional regulator
LYAVQAPLEAKHVRCIVVNVVAKPKAEKLSREAIVDSAIALADAEGLEAVTIRRLAIEHRVTPMALYWHFKDKERLLDGIAERLYAEVVLPPADAGGPWSARLRACLTALLDVLRAHPALVSIMQTRIFGSEPALEVSERCLGLLAEGGFDDERAAQIGSQALCMMVLMVDSVPGAQVGESAERTEQQQRQKQASLLALDPARYPHVIGSSSHLTHCSSTDVWFEAGLEMLFEGIEGVSATVPAEAGSGSRSGPSPRG